MSNDQAHRLVFDSHVETQWEDGRQSITMEFAGTAPQVFVRLLSWDEGNTEGHHVLAPYLADPGSIRITVELDQPPVLGPAAGLSDRDLDLARQQATAALGRLAEGLARARDPRLDLPEASISLYTAELAGGEARLAEIDAEIRRRRGQ